MVKNQVHNSAFDLSNEQIQSLIATSTGFIETYVIPVHGDADILIPQNMVLSAMSVAAHSPQVEWHDKYLPTYDIHRPDLEEVTALVIDGDTEQTRFAILCDAMPQTLRLRISEVLDIDKPTPEHVYQYVRVNETEYQIPHLSHLQHKLFSTK